MAPSPLALSGFPLQLARAVGSPDPLLVLLRVQAAAQPLSALPDVTAVLVLDVSGSMKGAPLEHVKQSVACLAEILGPNDSLGIVRFASTADVLCPISPLRAPDTKPALRKAVAGLFAKGYTNLSAGLSKAALLFPPRAAHERQLIVLLSDGHPNVGTSTKEGLFAEGVLIKQRQVAISSLGYGHDHDEDLLLGLSRVTGGRYAFVKDPAMAAPSFARAVGAQRDVAAEQVSLTLVPAPGVELLGIVGQARTTIANGGLKIALGDLLLGEQVHVVAKLQLSGKHPSGSTRLLSATLCSQDAAGLESRSTIDLDCLLRPAGANAEVLADNPVRELVAMALATELRDKARTLTDQRQFPASKQLLREAQGILHKVYDAIPPEDTLLFDLHDALIDDMQLIESEPTPEQYKVLRKAQFDHQQVETTFNETSIGNTLHSNSHSAVALLGKLQRSLGPVRRAHLIVTDGPSAGSTHRLGPECRIGRAADNDIALPDVRATRRHALIQWVGADFVIHDLGSTLGTFVNGKNVSGTCILQEGDLITIGFSRLKFVRDDPAASR